MTELAINRPSYENGSGRIIQRTVNNLCSRLQINPPSSVISSCESHESQRASTYIDIYERMYLDHSGDHFREGQIIYEFGTGPGHVVEEFGKRGPSPIGSDIIPPKREVEAGIFVTNGSIPLGRSSVDLISATSVMHHIPRQYHSHYFGEFRRILKPDGYVFVQEDERGRNSVEHCLIRSVDRLVSGPEANAHRTNEQWGVFFHNQGFKVLEFDMLKHKKGAFELNKLFYMLGVKDQL